MYALLQKKGDNTECEIDRKSKFLWFTLCKLKLKQAVSFTRGRYVYVLVSCVNFLHQGFSANKMSRVKPITKKTLLFISVSYSQIANFLIKTLQFIFIG